jgi:hypothetical protein
MERSARILIAITVLGAACSGCAGPVQPELKSARSHQVNVDFENLVLLAKHGGPTLFYPFSRPHCPYYNYRARDWSGASPAYRTEKDVAITPAESVNSEPNSSAKSPAGEPGEELPPMEAPGGPK